MTELREGENTYRIVPIIMRDRNADRLIADIQHKIEEGELLTRKDLVPLALCLLMGGTMSLKVSEQHLTLPEKQKESKQKI